MAESKVSVGLPVYNGERWLRSTAESILNQSFSDLTLIISDNGSTDNTQAICEELQSEDKRVKYYRNAENVGVFRNYDLVFHRSNSEYFKWSAVGDLCDPAFIEKAVDILDANDDVVLVHCKTRLIGDVAHNNEQFLTELNLIDEDPTIRFRQYLSTVRLNNIMNGLIRAKDLGETCLNKVFHASDKCMIAELSLWGKCVEIPEELFFRRMESATATALKNSEETQEFYAQEPKAPANLFNWKTELTLMKGVTKAPITSMQKISLIAYVLRRMNWYRSRLFMDLVRYVSPSR